ncbi:hypothetical protein DPMN_176845 [Dreissena polymorpha]|uniref:RING-type domain-containing protein n=2 Tax=Dreissena polymorpha TaxID=45954 RepID=A0A9D4IL12_DREPO|nr:hypothetical protein DPMN_176845 [Dreissena polymorpha]
MRQRLDTFTGWPHTNGQPPQRLAEAGIVTTDAQPNNTLKCKVCHANESCIQVMPCNHLCLCVRCAHRAHRCPECGRNVEMSFRSYSASSSSAGNNDTS